MPADRLTDRALGRATLARQFLLNRSDASALEMIEHLCGLQAQAPDPPYFALWCRLQGFRPEDLASLVENRDVVRIVAMRGTVFALSARDALTLRPLTQRILDQDLHTNTQHRENLRGIDVHALAAAGRELTADGPLTAVQMRPLLESRFPGRDGASLAHGIRGVVPMVQVPPRGVWGKSGPPALVPLESWVDAKLDAAPDVDAVMLRYLAAFGPASVKDAQAWSGLTGLGEIFDRLRPRLRVYLAESGAELFDLPEFPRPESDTAVPVRILAPFDNVLLSHADRTRIVDPEVRARIITQNGIVKPAVLVNGRVVGFASTTRKNGCAVLNVEPLKKIASRNRDSVVAEGRRLLKFVHPDAETREVRFVNGRDGLM
ncbi:winged helix DNA-binding domain-containing protein [Rhodococcus sp. NPDC058521]|uniref:winged helix DNA-binding domain-containing protein n=1 Tax=Rhodococcus sp. NPDC058521 TaxID=3346536 RepID=UPI003649431D